MSKAACQTAPSNQTTPKSTKAKFVLPPCRVCDDQAAGFHYGANTCEACKGFFHRSLRRKGEYKCLGVGGGCDVKPGKQRSCPRCRFQRCLEAGMSRAAIKTGRYTYVKRNQDALEVQRLEIISKQVDNVPGSGNRHCLGSSNIHGRGLKPSSKMAATHVTSSNCLDRKLLERRLAGHVHEDNMPTFLESLTPLDIKEEMTTDRNITTKNDTNVNIRISSSSSDDNHFSNNTLELSSPSSITSTSSPSSSSSARSSSIEVDGSERMASSMESMEMLDFLDLTDNTISHVAPMPLISEVKGYNYLECQKLMTHHDVMEKNQLWIEHDDFLGDPRRTDTAVVSCLESPSSLECYDYMSFDTKSSYLQKTTNESSLNLPLTYKEETMMSWIKTEKCVEDEDDEGDMTSCHSRRRTFQKMNENNGKNNIMVNNNNNCNNNNNNHAFLTLDKHSNSMKSRPSFSNQQTAELTSCIPYRPEVASPPSHGRAQRYHDETTHRHNSLSSTPKNMYYGPSASHRSSMHWHKNSSLYCPTLKGQRSSHSFQSKDDCSTIGSSIWPGPEKTENATFERSTNAHCNKPRESHGDKLSHRYLASSHEMLLLGNAENSCMLQKMTAPKSPKLEEAKGKADDTPPLSKIYRSTTAINRHHNGASPQGQSSLSHRQTYHTSPGKNVYPLQPHEGPPPPPPPYHRHHHHHHHHQHHHHHHHDVSFSSLTLEPPSPASWSSTASNPLPPAHTALSTDIFSGPASWIMDASTTDDNPVTPSTPIASSPWSSPGQGMVYDLGDLYGCQEAVIDLLTRSHNRHVLDLNSWFAERREKIETPSVYAESGAFCLEDTTDHRPEKMTKWLDKSVRGLVHFARAIPGFSSLPMKDRMTLIRVARLDFNALTLAQADIPWDRFQDFLLISPGATRELTVSKFGQLRDRIQGLGFGLEEVVLMKAMVIVATDRAVLTDTKPVEEIANQLTCCLLHVLEGNHFRPGPVLARLVSLLVEIRTITSDFLLELKGLGLKACDFHVPLLREMYTGLL